MTRPDHYTRSIDDAERLARDDVSRMDDREPPDPVGLDKLPRRAHPAIVADDFRTPPSRKREGLVPGELA